MAVHPTAIVERGAHIEASADIGPYCIVGAHAVIGAHTRLMAHVVVQGRTTLGERNVVHPFACLGGTPQDLKFRGEAAELVIGNDNTLREGVTLNIGTAAGAMRTLVGNKCLLMAYAHVAHDCVLGDGVILANGVGLAGHVCIDDNATVGGLAAVHQYCRIGRLAFIGGGSMVAQDVLPFCIAQGDRASLAGLNVVGLRRQGFDRSRISLLREALRTLFASGHARQRALALLEGEAAAASDDVAELVRFVRQAERGICTLRTTAAPAAQTNASASSMAGSQDDGDGDPPRQTRETQKSQRLHAAAKNPLSQANA